MKKTLIWILAFIITLGAAYYQRKTGPTYPKRIDVKLNDTVYKIKLVRSLETDDKAQVILNIDDPDIEAVLYYKRYKTIDKYESVRFVYKEESFYAGVPVQPPAGKLQYYIELTDSTGTRLYFKDNPVIIRFKDTVPWYVLIPHVLLMFMVMLFSTATGLMSVSKIPEYKKYGNWTLILLIAGGIIMGPIVQLLAFGELWTGVPLGWDLTDNKTLIALIFWILAVILNRKYDRPQYMALAALILLVIFSIPHSMFGSELDYSTGEINQGIIFVFFLAKRKKFLN